MSKGPAARVDSGLAQLLAGILLIIIGTAILQDQFWRLVLVAAGLLTITTGIGNIRRARREAIEQAGKNQRPTPKQQTVRSSIWAGAGAIIIIVKGSLSPDNLSPLWVPVGATMIFYGLTNVALTLLRK